MFALMMMIACTTPASTSHANANDEILSAADAKDGTADKKVTLCAGCALGMDGDPAHPVHIEDYELHFCSESCATNFQKDMDKSMKNLGKAVK